MADEALTIDRVVVGEGRIRCWTRLAPWAPRDTSPRLMEEALRRFPSLPHHACVNGGAPGFGAVMDDTPLPHLLEHIAIDIQTRAADDDSVYVGTTEWLDRDAGEALVELSFTDDLAALRALRDAAGFLNDCVRRVAPAASDDVVLP